MTINGISGSNPYIQPQNTEMTGQVDILEKEQDQGTPENRTDQTTPELSNQAFQVSITSQAMEILQSEQQAMGTEPGNTPPAVDNTTQANGQETAQDPSPGSKRIVDLVA
ncbi:hypothetical protein HRM2_32030 [Desulforapulum autotrophicum HRM2]|uniref:Uncharacterized protein n=1 Tax=Desulforapulum autotrophicum (strain ATCC 43914 / DSM 3382 / VKM B-1955 / HRM2) TaxID=177437 RepID=C0QLH9_DESAH|nr:hypothetical protein [Desulforapulum autotrophicum]ACN16283.1 hypothetical protein HRM2_32030 [Desulforapulum autotrophicum HRM2]